MGVLMKVVNNIVYIQLSEKIFVEDATLLRENLSSYLDKGYNSFQFDLGQLSFIDSTGLGVFISVHKRALQNGGSVSFTNVNGSVKELFELTRLTKVFNIN